MTAATIRFGLTVLIGALLAACGGGSSPPTGPGPGGPRPLATGPAACEAGAAADFACSGIGLRARLPHADMGGSMGNDIWGWVDTQSGREYALVGMTDGTAFVDVTDADSPVYLGRLPTRTAASTWRDIKVFQDHAYIVADGAGAHGLQVFDLTRLRGLAAPETFAADVTYDDFGNAHNIAINEATGFAYAVGTNTCGEGLHMIDITTPVNPLFAGCHADVDTHDTQCVVYDGPDSDHPGREICINSNGNHFEVVDVSVKGATRTLSALVYPQLGFVHQAWLTEDHRFALIGDELDEQNFGVPTRTHVVDLADLDNPAHLFAFEAATQAVDHNLYVLGNRVFQANYTAGLRVLEFGDLAREQLAEVAFFDTYPQGDAARFSGAWSVYPYLPSGNLIVNDSSNGLFVLTVNP